MGRSYISVELDRRVREAAQNRCGYCLSPQHLVMARLEIEHLIPLSKQGSNDESNLWLACPICNGHKSDKTTAINPKTQKPKNLFRYLILDFSYGLNIFAGLREV
jgi:5-methylcytosine-specific restriction endonuclease McrA